MFGSRLRVPPCDGGPHERWPAYCVTLRTSGRTVFAGWLRCRPPQFDEGHVKKRLLDTGALISYWRKCSARLATKTENDARTWADDLIEFLGTDAIVSPVYIEMIAGTSNDHELLLTRAFLSRFRNIDNWRVLPEDWLEARRIAERIPRNGKPRQLGDCLVRAIANRLRVPDVWSPDQDFPR